MKLHFNENEQENILVKIQKVPIWLPLTISQCLSSYYKHNRR